MPCVYVMGRSRGVRLSTDRLYRVASGQGWSLYQPDHGTADTLAKQIEMLVETVDAYVLFRKKEGSDNWHEFVTEYHPDQIEEVLGALKEVGLLFKHDKERCGALS